MSIQEANLNFINKGNIRNYKIFNFYNELIRLKSELIKLLNIIRGLDRVNFYIIYIHNITLHRFKTSLIKHAVDYDLIHTITPYIIASRL